MGTKKEYIIGDTKYKTKKAAYICIKEIVKSSPVNIEIYENSAHFEQIHNILKLHKQYEFKRGCGIKCFQVKEIMNVYNNPELQTHLKRTDDSTDVFTYSHILDETDTLGNLMRNMICSETKAFKQNSKKTHNNILGCAMCKNDTLPYEKYHTDHIKPFDHIKKEFLSRNAAPMKFARNDESVPILMECDKQFGEDWIKYHTEQAHYQILCVSCNCSKGNRI